MAEIDFGDWDAADPLTLPADWSARCQDPASGRLAESALSIFGGAARAPGRATAPAWAGKDGEHLLLLKPWRGDFCVAGRGDGHALAAGAAGGGGARRLAAPVLLSARAGLAAGAGGMRMRELILAVRFLTRLPTPSCATSTSLAGRLRPLVCPVGALDWRAALAALAALAWRSPWLAAALTLLLWVWLTGALHLDGLADLA